jgi:hypothetical protein
MTPSKLDRSIFFIDLLSRPSLSNCGAVFGSALRSFAESGRAFRSPVRPRQWRVGPRFHPRNRKPGSRWRRVQPDRFVASLQVQPRLDRFRARPATIGRFCCWRCEFLKHRSCPAGLAHRVRQMGREIVLSYPSVPSFLRSHESGGNLVCRCYRRQVHRSAAIQAMNRWQW